jgi:hypothetical protein
MATTLRLEEGPVERLVSRRASGPKKPSSALAQWTVPNHITPPSMFTVALSTIVAAKTDSHERDNLHR